MKKEIMTEKEYKNNLSRLMRDEKRKLTDVIKEYELNRKQSFSLLHQDENNPQ